MLRAGRRMTYADLCDLPARAGRHELYDGSLLSVPPPSTEHDAVVARIESRLRDHITGHGGQLLRGPMAVVFSPHDVVQPDLMFFHASRCGLIHDVPPVRHAPDLVIEVLAPSTSAIARGTKMSLLAREGVPEYWLADPTETTIEVYILRTRHYEPFQKALGRDRIRSMILPDLALAARDLFQA